MYGFTITQFWPLARDSQDEALEQSSRRKSANPPGSLCCTLSGGVVADAPQPPANGWYPHCTKSHFVGGVSDADLAQLHTLVDLENHDRGRRPLPQTFCAKPAGIPFGIQTRPGSRSFYGSSAPHESVALSAIVFSADEGLAPARTRYS